MKIHEKYGLNPTMTTCFFCGEVKDILLVGAHVAKAKEVGLCSSDGKMNRTIGCVDKEPCQKCKGFMKHGIILISVKDGEEGANPYKTGGWVVVKEGFMKKVTDDIELINSILRPRMSFIPDEVWDVLGFPRGIKS